MIKDFDLAAVRPSVPYQKPRGEWGGANAAYVVDTLLARVEALEDQLRVPSPITDEELKANFEIWKKAVAEPFGRAVEHFALTGKMPPKTKE